MLEHLPRAIGAALENVRPGLERTIAHSADLAGVPSTIRVSSAAFADGGAIPARYTEDGDELSPPLAWTGVPAGTQAVMLAIEDADSPTPAPLVHALAYDLPGRDGELAEGALPTESAAEEDGPALGRNSFLSAEYLPPDPPPGHGPHRYVFQVFALDGRPDLSGHPGRGAFVEALRGRVLAKGVLVGTYERA